MRLLKESDVIRAIDKHTREDGTLDDDISIILEEVKTVFDKEKVIEELKSWEKASHDAGIQSKYAGLDNKASGYYQESRAYHRAVEIVEKGGELMHRNKEGYPDPTAGDAIREADQTEEDKNHEEDDY